jgi:hypothetical protein
MSNQIRSAAEIAAWLVDNTSLTFEQVATGCNLPLVAVQALADGEAAESIEGAVYVRQVEPWFTRWREERTEADPESRILSRALYRSFTGWMEVNACNVLCPSVSAFGRALSAAGFPVGGKDGRGLVWRQGVRLRPRSGWIFGPVGQG